MLHRKSLPIQTRYRGTLQHGITCTQCGLRILSIRWKSALWSPFSLLVGIALIPVQAVGADCPATSSSELLACLPTLVPGDRLLIAPGRYEVATISLAGVNGEPGLPITFEGSGAGVEIVGTSYSHNVISFHDNHDLVFRNLDISFIGGSDTRTNGVEALKFEDGISHDILIEECTLHDVGNVLVGSQAPETHHVTLRHNELRNAGVCCMYLGYFDSDPKRYVHDFLIESNLMTDCPADARSQEGYGIQIKAGSYGNIVQDNVLVDVSGTTRAGIVVYHTAETIGAPLRANNIIRRNLILRSRNEGIDAAAAAVVENNIVVDAASYGFYFQGRDGYTGPVQVLHNTAYMSGTTGTIRGFMFSNWEGVDGQSLIDHNLSLMARTDLIAFRAPNGIGQARSSNNLSYGASDIAGVSLLSSPTQAVFNVSYGDPNFLFPIPDGLAVNVGTSTTGVRDDFNGSSRDSLPDVGAYESTGGVNPGWTLQETFKGEDGASGGGCSAKTSHPIHPQAGGAGAVLLGTFLMGRRRPRRKAQD